MENIYQSQLEAQISQVDQQTLASGKWFAEFVASSMGAHYLKNFDSEKVRIRKELDRRIEDMLERGKGIILFGSVGVGKTMDLVYISKRIIAVQKRPKFRLSDGFSVTIVEEDPKIPISYQFMPFLFNKLHFAESIELNKFIMLDDWGREYPEPFALSRFEILIEKAYSAEKSLVITTNLTKDQFLNREGWARITDRVREMCSVIEIPGESMRHK